MKTEAEWKKWHEQMEAAAIARGPLSLEEKLKYYELQERCNGRDYSAVLQGDDLVLYYRFLMDYVEELKQRDLEEQAQCNYHW